VLGNLQHSGAANPSALEVPHDVVRATNDILAVTLSPALERGEGSAKCLAPPNR
jgi:hypothetical protein